jgi:inosine-uridine nucleoside N-ribohydrolase
MGGTVNGWGNITATAEFNFRCDPEAAKICIGSFKYIHLLPWETAYNFKVTKEGKISKITV